MAKKPNITTIASGYYSRLKLNENFENLQNGFDNTLSLDGSTPNAMGADLDFNNNNAINIASLDAQTLTLGGSSVDLSDIQTLTGIGQDIQTLADIEDGTDATDAIQTAASVSSDISVVSGISTDVTTVSSDSADVQTLADVEDGTVALNAISTLGPISTDITTVSGISSDVTAVSNIDTNVTTVAGISTDVPTVSGISSDVTTVSGINTDVTTVSGISSDVTTVAANVTDVTNFADVYIGPAASDPATRNDGSPLQEGDLYFNTNTNLLFVYNGSDFQTSPTPFSTFATTLIDDETAQEARQTLGLKGGATTEFFDDVSTLLADTSTYPAGTIIRTREEGFAYRAVDTATATTVANAGAQYLRVLPAIDGFYHGKSFGAKHDGVTDDSAAYIKAFAASEENISQNIIGVFVDQGVTVWDAPVVAEKSGNHFVLRGAGKRQSKILAGPNLTGTMLRIGQSSGVFARNRIEALMFDMNFTAATALDMEFCRYSEVMGNEFTKPADAGQVLRIGRWVNRVMFNIFNGRDSGGNPTAATPLYVPNDTVNNFMHGYNSYTTFSKPVLIERQVNDFHSFGNSYDFMPGGALAFINGGRKITIEKESFERCGGLDADGTAISAAAGGTATYNAPIVISRDPSSPTTTVKSVTIKDNAFKNSVNSKSHAVLSGVEGLHYENNNILDGYTIDHAVRIVEHGVGASIGRQGRVLIDQDNLYDNASGGKQFLDGVVSLEGADAEIDHIGMEIIERPGYASTARIANGPIYDLIPSDLTSARYSVVSGTVTQSGSFEGVDPIYELTGDAHLRLNITCDAGVGYWPGRYVRVGFLHKGTAGTANGLDFDILVDQGAGLVNLISSTRTTNDAWGRGAPQMTVRIPDDTVSIRFRLRQINAADTLSVTRLHVDSAAAPIRW